MAYTINKTDSSTLLVLADGTFNNTSTTLTLVGKNYSGYGEFLNENFVKLLENHASVTPPPEEQALPGQLWYDKNTRVLKVWNGSDFRSLGGATSSSTAPTGNNNGDLWWDTATKQLKVWDSATNKFIVVGPLTSAGTGQTGAIPTIIQDAAATDYVVVLLVVQDKVVGVISKSPTFTPAPAIPGFSTIKPGINLFGDAGFMWHGTASNADLLDGLDSSAFVKISSASPQIVTSALGTNGLFTVGPVSSSNKFSVDSSGALTAAVALKNNAANSGITIGTVVAPTAISIAADGTVTIAGGITGNASTATALQTTRKIAGKNFNGTQDVTLDDHTPGSYLTGNVYNGSTAQTWAVNATTANTPNTVVARDGAGNFSAGTITANLTGNATTASSLGAGSLTINGSPITTGTVTTVNWGTGRNITIGNTTKVVNGSQDLNWTRAEIGGSFPTSTTVTSTSKTLAAFEFCTVVAAGLTLTLPATPAAGTIVAVSINGNITNTVLARNGQNIMGVADNLTIDRANIGLHLIFSDATRGWRLL